MIQASFGEGLPSANVSTTPRFTFWRDPVAFSQDPRQRTPVPTQDGRPVPTSTSRYPRPTRHLSGSLGNTIGIGVMLSGLVGGFLLWRKWKGSSKAFGSSTKSKRQIAEELKKWDRLRMNEGRPRAKRPVWFVDPETGDLIELDYGTATFKGLGARSKKKNG